ncbi:MAG: restriction endonuclease subunit S [Trueperaceae bacterium]
MSDKTPTHWLTTTLGDVTNWMSGGTPSKSNPDFWGGTIPWLSAKSIKSFYLHDSEDRVTEAAIAGGVRLAVPGDILMLVRGMTLHNDVPMGIATRPMTFNQDVKGIRGANGADTRFTAYWLLAHKAQLLAAVDQASHGTGRLQTDVLHAMELRLPPLPVQRAIAGVLGALDDKIEQNRRTARALERLARALFRAWFVDFEPVKVRAAGAASFPSMPQPVFDALPTRFVDSATGPVPEGWKVKAIGDVVSAKGGGTPSTKNPEYWAGGEHCWATPKDLSRLSHPVLLNTERRITDAGVSSISSGILPVGTVLMSSRAPVGYLAIAGVPIAINQGFIAMVCDGPLPPTYVLNWAVASMDAIKAHASGTTFPEISKKNFRPLPVVVATPEVIAAYQQTADSLFNALTSCVKESERLAQVRDFLLPQLLSGAVRADCD